MSRKRGRGMLAGIYLVCVVHYSELVRVMSCSYYYTGGNVSEAGRVCWG